MVRQEAFRSQRPRLRAVVALMLFVVLSAGSVGVVGHVQAGDAILPGEPVELDTLVLPEPRIGDRWTYTRLDTKTGELLRGDQYPESSMSWLEPVVTLGTDGVAWRTPLLSYVYAGAGPEELSAIAVHPVNGTIIGKQYATGGRNGNQNVVHQMEDEHRWAGSSTNPPHLLCYTALHLVPGGLDTEAGFPFPACLGGFLDHGRAIHMEPVGAYRANDHVYMVFDNKGKGGDVERVVFRTDLPVPTLIVKRTHAEPHARALTAFSPGSGGPVLQAQPPVYELPSLSHAPLVPWGLDDAGVDHPYPLSAAWQDAWDDTDHPLRPFVEAQPEAGIHSMTYFEREGDESLERRWDWILSAPEDQATFCQTREEKKPPYETLHPLQEAVSGAEEDHTCTDRRTADRAVRHLGQGPTVASLHEAWRVHAEAEGFPAGPIFWSQEGGDGDASFTVGVRWQEEEDDGTAPLGSEEYRYQTASITFAEDGTVDGTARSFSSLRYTFVNLEDQEDGEEAALRPQEAGPTAPVPVWVFPALQDALTWSVIALLLAALYWLFPHLKHGVLAPFFSRITKDAALSNETRAAILAAVESEPGIHDRELQRRLDLARGQLRHHLDKLIETGLLTRKRIGGFTGYWPSGSPYAGAAEQAAVLRAPLAQEVHALLQKEPDLSAAAVAERLGRSRQSVSYHLGRLRKAGLLPS